MIKILHAEKELDDEHLLPVNNSKYLQEFDDRSDITIEGDLDAKIESPKHQHVYEKKVSHMSSYTHCTRSIVVYIVVPIGSKFFSPSKIMIAISFLWK